MNTASKYRVALFSWTKYPDYAKVIKAQEADEDGQWPEWGDSSYHRVSNWVVLELDMRSTADQAADALATLRRERTEAINDHVRAMSSIADAEATYLALGHDKQEQVVDATACGKLEQPPNDPVLDDESGPF